MIDPSDRLATERNGFLRERDEARAQLTQSRADTESARSISRRVIAALDVCDGNRGAFSCADQHDLRCPKARGKPNAACECGRDELDAARAAFDALSWAKERAA
jgi:hypothetical protein